MAPGRPRLDPEVKQQRRAESLQRYAANKYRRNADKLREQARVRMQRHRAAIADSHTSTKLWYAERGAEASERYRRRKHEHEWEKYRAANMVKKGAREKEAEKLRKKHLPAAAAHLPSAPQQPTEAGVHEEGSMSEEEDTDEQEKASEAAPVLPRRITPPRCPECYCEGCPGCACMCPVSTDWIEHEDGHFFPTCKACGGEDCPGCRCICSKSKVLTEHNTTTVKARSSGEMLPPRDCTVGYGRKENPDIVKWHANGSTHWWGDSAANAVCGVGGGIRPQSKFGALAVESSRQTSGRVGSVIVYDRPGQSTRGDMAAESQGEHAEGFVCQIKNNMCGGILLPG
ncbi:hypothetical protein DFH08DRAFT_797907 [Mycena albidolilacea]|uniref:Uncharacterized protein n=1 Tax=Mycena albidolilacea TaxID=1033008 RepID=A0AAD7ASC7_9AGAR|nr:hypothetical protein DFH08DRAFT_797907 [Mycena albidolilacea]